MVHWNKHSAVHARYAVLFIRPLLIALDPMVYFYLCKDFYTAGGQELWVPPLVANSFTTTGSLWNSRERISKSDTTKGEGS